MKEERCYFSEFSTCTCSYSAQCDRQCVGAAECGDYVAESEYFSKLMNGEIKESRETTEDKKERQARINSKLSPGKTKKQLKYEQRQQDIKDGKGTGYSLADNPNFKGLFGKK